MALADTIAEISGRSVAPKNRVDILLEKWAGAEEHAEDYETLLAALHNEAVTSAALTRAIRQETKTHSVVKDGCVAEWRRKNASTEVTGL